MALTKAGETLTDWTEVAAQGIVLSGEIVLSSNYSTGLAIELALNSTTPHDGTEATIQVSSSTTGEGDWHDLLSIILASGTAATEALGASEPAAETVIAVASTTGFVTNGALLFVEDNVIADSELVRQSDYTTDTSITILAGLENAHDTSDALWNVAVSRVFAIPPEWLRARVVINNDYDSGASTIVYRVKAAKITGV